MVYIQVDQPVYLSTQGGAHPSTPLQLPCGSIRASGLDPTPQVDCAVHRAWAAPFGAPHGPSAVGWPHSLAGSLVRHARGGETARDGVGARHPSSSLRLVTHHPPQPGWPCQPTNDGPHVGWGLSKGERIARGDGLGGRPACRRVEEQAHGRGNMVGHDQSTGVWRQG